MRTHSPTRTRGFTLIELLVVIGIIALLAAILLPVVQGVFKRADILKAKNEVGELRKAVEAYFNTYGKLPLVPSSETTALSEGDSKKVVQILTAISSVTAQYNPREKIFLELKEIRADGEFLDPWGKQYFMRLDKNLDGKMTIPGSSNETATRSIMTSAGPDGQEGTPDDISTLSK